MARLINGTNVINDWFGLVELQWKVPLVFKFQSSTFLCYLVNCNYSMTKDMETLKLKKDTRVTGVKCAVHSCGATRRENSQMRLFKFPAADKILGQIWREKCQIAQSQFNHNFFICSRHFEDHYIGRRKLKTEAIPTLHLDNEEDLQMEDYDFPPTPKAVEGMHCKFCKNHVKAYRVLSRNYGKLRSRYEKLRVLFRKTRRRAPIAKRSGKKIIQNLCSTIDALDIGTETKTLTKLLLSSRQKQYSPNVKHVALNLFFKSPSTYRLMRDNLHLHLPHENTLHQWSPIKSLQPGIKNSAMGVLAHRIRELKVEDAQHMVLVFDEMAIRKNLSYNSYLDLIDGFESNGLERKKNLAGYVCVFMIKCVYTNWSSIVNHFVSSSNLGADTLSVLIKKIIQLLSQLGVKIRAIVCDQQSCNRKCFSILGVSIERPYFIFEDTKIYCLYDFPHLIKSLRNGWLKCDIITPDGTVSFNVIKSLFEMEQNATTKMCPKLTLQHIQPNTFEEMRVKLATQVFSHTVQAAIRTINDTIGFKNISKEMALSTANFIQNVDKVFDCLNSGSLHANNPYRSAVQLNNIPHNFIKHFLEYLNGVKFTDKKKRVFFIEGMKLTLHSLLLLVEDFLNENSDYFFIPTKSLNQDTLENTFSIIRQMGGNNDNPTVAELNTILAKILTTKILRSTTSANCENEDVYTSISIPDAFVHEPLAAELPSATLEETDCPPDSHIDLDIFRENESEYTLDKNATRYFIGFCLFKKLKQINCSACSDNLLKQEDTVTASSEFFIHHKNYQSYTTFGELVAPSDSFMNVSEQHILAFRQIFQSEAHKIGLKASIKRACMDLTPDWFSDTCGEHREIILDYIITILIRKHCLWSVKKGGRRGVKHKLDIIFG